MSFLRMVLLGMLSGACGGSGGDGRSDDPAGSEMEDPVIPVEGRPDGSVAVDGGATPPTDAPPGEEPVPDAAPPPAPPPPEPLPPEETTTVWSDVDKCNRMCGGYCAKRQACDGTDPSACRMAIDADNGGSCETRGDTFAGISQERVEGCLEAIQAMRCSDFLAMYNTGTGVPSACQGILD